MEKHLFRALVRNRAARAHPILAALLYAFCPAASRWWLAGVEPAMLFDPLWAALAFRASGQTLRGVLEAWQLDGLLPYARRYVHKVEAYRGQAQNRRITSPEQLPTFMEGNLPLQSRHRYSDALEKLGGWKNFYPFLRAWAFVLPDWFQQLKLSSDAVIQLEDVAIRFEGLPDVRMPSWKFGERNFAFLGGIESEPGSFRMECVARYAVVAAGCETFRLDDSGLAHPIRPEWPEETLAETVQRLTNLALDGPYPPLAGLNSPAACTRCGFTAVCRGATGGSFSGLSRLALHF